MSKIPKSLLTATQVALADQATDIPVPPRTRSFSFASMLADMQVGDAPASKSMLVDLPTELNSADKPVLAMKDIVSTYKERLRNNIASSITAAKRRVEGAAYSVECGTVVMDSGLYVVAIVSRTA